MGDSTTIGNYRVLGKLGEGGMGVVYLAEHALLGRRAAVKVLLPELSAHRDIVQRFFNEARAVTQIADPGIVQVFDFGYHGDGSAYIVMELLEGEPMDRRLERIGRFTPIDASRLARLVCTSLSSAHAKGVVHRDLKPENIFLVGDPAVTGGERPKVLDFGIAKLSGDEPGKLKTRTGMVMGTPVYMSPEQCRGAGDVDHRSDIYSLGCMLMTMLTGRPPFEREGSGELIIAHVCEPPPLASSRVPGLPDAFDQILQRCLAKVPADRFQTMGELSHALAQAEAVLLSSSMQTIAAQMPLYMPSGTTPLPGLRVPTPPPTTPTTLNGAAAQSVPPAQPARGGRRAYTFAVIGAVAVVGIAIGLLAIVHGGGGGGDEPAAALAPAPTEPASPVVHAAPPPDAAPAEPIAHAAPPIDAAPPADAASLAQSVPPADAAAAKPQAKPHAPAHHASKPHADSNAHDPAAGSAAVLPEDRGD